MAKRAEIAIKALPHYRREAFEACVKVHGFTVGSGFAPEPDDLFVTWNLHGSAELRAETFRRAGAKVIVVENGAIGKDRDGLQLYSMARDYHHAGTWYIDFDDRSRWDALGIDVKPWSNNPDGHVLICAQRGIGSRLMASPPGFERDADRQIRAGGYLNTRIRKHPGAAPTTKPTPLEDDLKGARVCAIWSSMSGVKALVHGIPVAYFAPHWIASIGAAPRVRGVQMPLVSDKARMQALIAVSWYQWTVAEIARGVPLEYLLKLR